MCGLQNFQSGQYTDERVLTSAPTQELVPLSSCCDSYWQEMWGSLLLHSHILVHLLMSLQHPKNHLELWLDLWGLHIQLGIQDCNNFWNYTEHIKSLVFLKFVQFFASVWHYHPLSFYFDPYLQPKGAKCISCSSAGLLSIHPHVTTWAPLKQFPWNLILGSFTKICQHIPLLVDTRQQQQAIYMKTDMHVYSPNST